jgi:hypothetical protein
VTRRARRGDLPVLAHELLAVRDGGADAAPARRLAVRPGVVTLVAEHRSRNDVRADVEQDREVAAVAGLAAGQAERERPARPIDEGMDLGGTSAARAADGLALFPPLWNGPLLSSTMSG